MKTIEKSTPVSKALIEVWEWKDQVYEDIKDMTFEEKRKYFEEGLRINRGRVHLYFSSVST